MVDLTVSYWPVPIILGLATIALGFVMVKLTPAQDKPRPRVSRLRRFVIGATILTTVVTFVSVLNLFTCAVIAFTR